MARPINQQSEEKSSTCVGRDWLAEIFWGP
jgi:hypothetical protein